MAANEIMAATEMMAPAVTANCQYSTRYCWEADKVKSLIRLRAELSPLFTGKRNASKYAWAVVERELNVPLPLSKIIKKWNNLLQEYKAIKMSEEPKRREWPFFTLMDVYFSDQVNDPSLRLFSSTKTLKETIDDSVFEDDPIIASAIAAATSGAYMDIEELVRRQKERAADKKFAAAAAAAAAGVGVGADEFAKFGDIKPMLASSKFNSGELAKLSKSVDDLSMQRELKIKEEILRQREQEQQENIVKIKQHARQQQQRYQQQQQQQQQQQAQQQAQAQQQQQQAQREREQQREQQLAHHQHLATPPPGLHALHHQQHLHQQQQQHLQHQQQQHHQHQRQPPPHLQPPPTPPTTAQQIHLHTAQHQAQQQQLHLQQHQHQQQQQFADPNTIDQYLLSWNNFHGNMCRGFHTLQKDEKMVDVTIAAGGRIFKAHKLVLSVCSPYFQQIFLENPSSHPILLMADVEASHMAGLLDFMYSGQVNVKYEDLPVFLKVAEAMKIKGLHTEKNMDEDCREPSAQPELESTECHFDRATHSVNITGQAYGQSQLQQQLEPGMNGLANSSSNNTNNSNSSSNNSNTPLPVQSFSSFRDHIKTKAALAETFMKNLSRNNNNSNSSSSNNGGSNVNNGNGNGNNNNNSNTNSNSNSNGNGNGNNYSNLGSSGSEVGAGVASPGGGGGGGDGFGILQAASSKKMLDTRKQQHKYLAKRKILMHYNEELNEKRLKELERGYGADQQQQQQQHDTNSNSSNNNCQEEVSTTTTATTQVPQSQQSPHQNFKIRLLENHRSDSTEEEALNLVQNATSHAHTYPHTHTHTHSHALTHAHTHSHETQMEQRPKPEQRLGGASASETEMEIDLDRARKLNFTQEDSDNNNVHANANNNNTSTSTNDDDDDNQPLRKFAPGDDDNNNSNNKGNSNELLSNNNSNSNKNNNGNANANNNTSSTITTATDSNNNHSETNKNAALINAINKSLERKVLLRDDDDDNNNNNNNNDSNNNNNDSELDLSSAVKNIATAEILCGLKSKVFKIKQEEGEGPGQPHLLHHHHHLHQHHQQPQHQQPPQQQCRSLSEIKNAD